MMKASWVVSLVCLTGCTLVFERDDDDRGGGNTDPPPDAAVSTSPAQDKFAAEVTPALQAKCSGGSCHSETGQVSSPLRFVSLDPSRAYDAVVGFNSLVTTFTPDHAPLLAYIESGTHYGVAYTPQERTAIAGWLDLELHERFGLTWGSGSESPNDKVTRLLEEFRWCMTASDFQAANMATAWSTLTASNNQACENCHATGADGFITARDESFFYSVFSTRENYFLAYFTVDFSGGIPEASVVFNQRAFQNVASGRYPHSEHPRFDADINQGEVAAAELQRLVSMKFATRCVDGPGEAKR